MGYHSYPERWSVTTDGVCLSVNRTVAVFSGAILSSGRILSSTKVPIVNLSEAHADSPDIHSDSRFQ